MYKSNNTTKKILAADPAALRVLRGLFGMDFEKPFVALELSGAVTVNKICKAVKAAGLEAGATIACYIRDTARTGFRGQYNLVRICNGGKAEIDFRFYTIKTRALDYFYRKADFEEMRKLPTAETIVFAQSKAYQRPVDVETTWSGEQKLKPARPDFSGRVRVLSVGYELDKAGRRSVARLTVQELEGTGRAFDYQLHGRIRYAGEFCPESPLDVIDKSGYRVDTVRAEWKRRAAALRAERAQAAVAAADYSRELEQIAAALADRKAQLVAALAAAETAADVAAVEKALSRWNGYGRALENAARFRQKIAEKSYPTPAAVEKAFSEIMIGVTK